MNTTNGYFVISLDFELFWGVFDVRRLNDYKSHLNNVRIVIPRLLELADAYQVKLSFATVGFLFSKDKDDLLQSLPKSKPNYSNSKFNPYTLINTIGNSEIEDPFHYAPSLIELIHKNGNHEIGSHTFSHYYCNEEGQNSNTFSEDLEAAITIAKKRGITIKSIVFPRNQINNSYLKICANKGLLCYRGTETHWMFNTHDTDQLENPFYKAFRLLDNYINISGYNTRKLDSLKREATLVNIPSSKFLRPFNKRLKLLEPLRISRIKKGMSYAAKNNELYHLWWHPHNFGENIEENFDVLEQLFKHYAELNNNYTFKSETMSGVAEKL